MSKHTGNKFLIGAIVAWLLLIGAISAAATIKYRHDGIIPPDAALLYPVFWFGLTIALLARLAFNLTQPNQRRPFTYESFKIVCVLGVQLFLTVLFLTSKWVR
ncbi:MAG: hypothetical protein K8T25_23375 [Planctomycetia bacterium]|nr:hypothetical protein [Planctomycetia bacterium]